MENFTIDSWTTLLDVVLTASAPEGAFLKATTTTTMPLFDNSTDTNDTCDYETITDMHTRLAIFVPLGVLVGFVNQSINQLINQAPLHNYERRGRLFPLPPPTRVQQLADVLGHVVGVRYVLRDRVYCGYADELCYGVVGRLID